MKKIATVFTALLLGVTFCFAGGCGEDTANGNPPSVNPPIAQEKEGSLVLTSSSVDMQAKEALFYAGEEYTFSVGFGADTLESVDLSGVTVNLTGEGLTYQIKQKKIVVTAAAATQGKISVSATVDGKSYTSAEYTVRVIATERIRANATSYFLLAKEDLAGNAVLAENTNRQLGVYRYDQATGEQEITSQATYSSSNPSIVSVDASGKVSSVSSGSATITCTYAGETVEVSVDVYVPIYTAEDMDTLALCTYYEDKEEATRLLSQNYALMNDIDYSSHERNYILPIASPTIPDIHSVISRSNAVSGDCSYFSYAWKNILGLVQKEGSQGEQYLEKTDGTPFKGINPNAVKFTGVFDGNGYSIQNAWLMIDNVLYLDGVTSNNNGYTAGANCFIGYNYGILRNLSLTDFNIGQTHDQLYTVNPETKELENKYSFFSNSMWANWQDVNNRAKMQNAMSIIYRSGTFPGTVGETVVKYKSEINGRIDTAGHHAKQTYGGDTDYVSGRSMWGVRPNSGSALVFINEGRVENLYVDYFHSPNNGLGMLSGTFVVQNESAGVVKDCVAIIEVETSDARPEVKFYAGAVANNGTLENLSVAVAVCKRTDYGIFNAEKNTGKVVACASYLDKDEFMAKSKTLDKYNATIWNKETMVLNTNVYGFVR